MTYELTTDEMAEVLESLDERAKMWAYVDYDKCKQLRSLRWRLEKEWRHQFATVLSEMD